MSKIYKYQLTPVLKVVSAQVKQILSFQYQYGIPTVWIEIDESLPFQNITFEIIGTGWTFKLFGFTYLGTVQENGFVWHCYYKIGG